MDYIRTIEIFIDKIVAYMVSFGPLGGFLLVFLESLLSPLPLGIIVGLNILSFGNILGFFISYLGCALGSITVFTAVRGLFKEKFKIWNEKKERPSLNKWMNKLSNIKFTTLVVIFALPVTPSVVVNVAGGLSDIGYRKYFLALLIGKPAMLLIYAYITTTFVDALKNPIIFIKVFVLIILTYVISKIIEKFVKVE